MRAMIYVKLRTRAHKSGSKSLDDGLEMDLNPVTTPIEALQ